MLETVPLYLLYEASILVASLFGRSEAASTSGAADTSGSQTPIASEAAEPSVQQLIDHTDQDLSG